MEKNLDLRNEVLKKIFTVWSPGGGIKKLATVPNQGTN